MVAAASGPMRAHPYGDLRALHAEWGDSGGGSLNFTSDNAYGADPAIATALCNNATGTAAPYGNDDFTAGVNRQLSDTFAHEVIAFPVITGTAANALALATLCPPYGAILCHADSHIAADECGAPEFFSHGAKIIGLEGKDGKLTPNAVEAWISKLRPGVHSPKPSVLSITQLTEAGTVYQPDEIARLAETARKYGMSLHIDGARFANALASLGCEPADISWRAGADAVSFGATKNGAIGAEAVLFFGRTHISEFEYRRKKSGHLLSKMRFISMQFSAYLNGDRWIENARRANSLAALLADGLTATGKVTIVHPVEGNIIFAILPVSMARQLRASGALFYDVFPAQGDLILTRFVTSFSMPSEHVEQFIRLLASC